MSAEETAFIEATARQLRRIHRGKGFDKEQFIEDLSYQINARKKEH